MITFIGSTGALFNALGKLGAIIAEVKTYQTNQQQDYINPSTGAYPQLISQPDIQALIGAAWQNDLSGPENASNTAVTVSQQYLNRLVFLDDPQQNQSMQSLNLPASLDVVISQMVQQGLSVLQMTIAVSISGPFINPFVASPGNPVIVTSVRRPFDGRIVENSFPETIQVTCTQDSITGGATAFNEPFSVTGEVQQGDVFAYNWPFGSGSANTLIAINGDADSSQGNYLVNSGFASWTSNTPNNWAITVGVAGTNILQESTLTYSGPSVLNIVGDGSTLTSLQQEFGSTAGNPNSIINVSQYSCNLFVRRGGTSISAGVFLQVDLCSQTGTVLQDALGNPCSVVITASSLTTSYAPFHNMFRTPAILPDTIFMRIHLTTPLPAGQNIYVAKLSLGAAQQLYISGPSAAIHSGNIFSRTNDNTTILVTNSFGAGGTLSTWQIVFNQVFSMQQQDLLLPSSLSPNVSDSLIG